MTSILPGFVQALTALGDDRLYWIELGASSQRTCQISRFTQTVVLNEATDLALLPVCGYDVADVVARRADCSQPVGPGVSARLGE
jgi:hypothetical protein